MLLCIWIALCISVSPLFKEHLYSGDTFWERGCPMYESSLRVCISCPYWMDTSIQGTLILVKWVSHKWRLHCRIMFVSITSIEGTSPFRGHLSWSPECPLNGGSTLRPHWRVRCSYGKVTRGFFLRCPGIFAFWERILGDKQGRFDKQGNFGCKNLKTLKKILPSPY